jgi:osmotically-inducible protein OsmY
MGGGGKGGWRGHRWPLIVTLGLLFQVTPAVPVESASTHRAAAAPGTVQQVRERLAEDEFLRNQRIGVSESGMVVTLTGRVRGRGLADRAMELARRVVPPHVVVASDLTIEDDPLAEDVIAQSVAEHLVAQDRSAIVVSIEGGLVVLTGIASSQRQRQRLVEAVQRTAGVGAVIDRIQVRATPDAGQQR